MQHRARPRPDRGGHPRPACADPTPTRRSSAMRRGGAVLLALLLGALLLACSFSPTTVVGRAGHAAITYSFNPAKSDAATEAAALQSATPINVTLTATCPQGQKVLAGGFNLDGTSAVADWQIAHPAPANARPDATTHTCHPVADLVRVVSSEPKTDLSGWTIQVQGVVAPGTTDRPIEAYAYCAAGLSHVPQIVVAEGTANYVTGGPGGRNFLPMTCPAGTVIAGAGYTDFPFDDGSGTALMPVYSGFPEGDKWIVAPTNSPCTTPVR